MEASAIDFRTPRCTRYYRVAAGESKERARPCGPHVRSSAGSSSSVGITRHRGSSPAGRSSCSCDQLTAAGTWTAHPPTASTGQDVGARRVADHQEARWFDAVASEYLGVDVRRLVTDHLHVAEVATKARALELAPLVKQVALGDQRQRTSGRQLFQGFPRALEQLDLRGHHRLGHDEQFLDVAPRDAAPVNLIAVSISESTKLLTP